MTTLSHRGRAHPAAIVGRHVIVRVTTSLTSPIHGRWVGARLRRVQHHRRPALARLKAPLSPALHFTAQWPRACAWTGKWYVRQRIVHAAPAQLRRKERAVAGESRSTTDHMEIRRWVEARGGRPAAVSRTRSDDDPGIIRIDLPGYSGETRWRASRGKSGSRSSRTATSPSSSRRRPGRGSGATSTGW